MPITLQNALSHLPAAVAEIATVIGSAAALSLVDAAFARAEANGSVVTEKRPWRCFIYIPRTKRPAWIVSAIGVEKAEILRDFFGDSILELSACGRLADILRKEAEADLLARGFPPRIVRRVFNRRG